MKFIGSIPSTLIVGLARLYQLLVSPVIPQTCRFHPTCSGYAIEAVRTHGALRGVWLALRRIVRCNPWSAGGYDPVPEGDV
ncbi:MAG: membrane protein insertion efficiency factor YidD [Alphaproteobacteria bacterium]